MSDNKGYETMRDLVRALQQNEYGLRTGILSPDDLDHACDNARLLYERLVVIRHKARETRVHDEAKAKAPAAVGVPVAAIPVEQPEPVKEPVAVKAPEPAKQPEPVKEPVAVKAPEPAKQPEPVKEPVAVKAPEPVKQPEPVKEPVAEKAPEPVKQPEPVKEPVAVKAAEPMKQAEVVKQPEPMKQAEMVKQPEPVKEVVAETPKPLPVPEKAPEPKKEVLVEAPKPAPVAAPKVPKPTPVAEPVAAAPQPAVKVDTRPMELKQPAIAAVTETATEVAEASTALTAAQFLAAFRANTVPKPTPTVADKMEDAPVDDLLKAISVSDRFWFNKELFNGEKALFEKTIAQMNAASTLDEATSLLNKAIVVDPKRPANPEARTTLMELLQRRFA